MKKIGVFVTLLLFASLVSAHEGAEPAFSWDLFFEKMNVWLTFDSAEKVRLHLDHAAERIDEAIAADASARDAIVHLRETDLERARAGFEAHANAQLATDVNRLLASQHAQLMLFLDEDPDTAELMLEQNDAWDELLSDYDLPEEMKEEPARQENSITGAVVADIDVSADELVEVEADIAEVSEETLVSEEIDATLDESIDDARDDDITIVARTQGSEITRINVTIGDFTKGFVLSITDQNATLHEIMKRFNLTERQVIDNMDWNEG